MIGSGSAQSSQRFAGGLSQVQFLGIVCLFWVYVTVSNVLYGYSMSAGIARMTNVTVFATWDTRLLQHLLLLPMLLVSFWASLKVQWRPHPDRAAVADDFGRGVLRDGLPGDDSFRSHHGSRPIAWYRALACGQCLERSISG